MRLIVNGKNIEITTAIREYSEEKIGRVSKHFDQIKELEVTLSVVKNPSVQKNHIAEVTCSVNGARLHVTEEAETMYASIDLVADKLDRQVKKHKEKILKGKSGSASIRTDNVIVEESEENEENDIEQE